MTPGFCSSRSRSWLRGPNSLRQIFGAVIVAHARADLALRCVQTIQQSLPPENIVVVVNAPARVKDQDALDALKRQVTVVSPRQPQGYGANLNSGVAVLPQHVEFVVLSNDDVEFSSQWLPQIHGHFVASPRVGAVGFTLRDGAGVPLPSTGEFPTPLDALIRSVPFPGGLKRFLQRVDGRLRKRGRQARAVGGPRADADIADWVVGAAMVVRRDAFVQIGGFDERFFLYFEETDLCDRLWAQQWAVVTAKNASALHLEGQSTGNARYRRVFREARRRYLIKRMGSLRWMALELAYVSSLLLAAAIHLASAVVRPASARSRLDAFRLAWQRRVFLMF